MHSSKSASNDRANRGSDIADFVKGKTDPSYSGGGGGGAAEEVEIDKDEL